MLIEYLLMFVKYSKRTLMIQHFKKNCHFQIPKPDMKTNMQPKKFEMIDTHNQTVKYIAILV